MDKHDIDGRRDDSDSSDSQRSPTPIKGILKGGKYWNNSRLDKFQREKTDTDGAHVELSLMTAAEQSTTTTAVETERRRKDSSSTNEKPIRCDFWPCNMVRFVIRRIFKKKSKTSTDVVTTPVVDDSDNTVRTTADNTLSPAVDISSSGGNESADMTNKFPTTTNSLYSNSSGGGGDVGLDHDSKLTENDVTFSKVVKNYFHLVDKSKLPKRCQTDVSKNRRRPSVSTIIYPNPTITTNNNRYSKRRSKPLSQ